MKRKPLNKYTSARKFRHGAKHTKAINVRTTPQRGGWRL